MNALFICSANRLRSPTAETVFASYPGLEVSSAGTDPDAACPISLDLIEWADLIFVMETVHRNRLHRKFGSTLRAKKLIVLNIPDNYPCMDPGLIEILRQKVTPWLKRARL